VSGAEPSAGGRRGGAPRPVARADVTGIVLAGGRSSRFGRDKLAEPYRGAPLLHHPVRRLADACAEVVVVIAPRAVEPPLPNGVAAVRFARDATEFAGPLAGMLAGLSSARTPWALAAAGDMPGLQAPVLAELLATAALSGADAVALSDGGVVRPLPVALRASPAREAAGALVRAGHRRLRDLVSALRTAVIDESAWRSLDPDRRTLLDVDVPGDLSGPRT
jgi:molybdopterin-guanine dinucleotide biosynthesis protein A